MAVNLKNNKYVVDLKKGLQDMQTVTQEGNLKLFLKQGIAIAVIFLVFHYAGKEFEKKQQNYQGQMEAIRVQQTSEQEYMRNKNLLLSLEPQFPDIANKNEWLLSQVLGVFKNAQLAPQVSGSQAENDSNPTYVSASLDVATYTNFAKFAEFLAGIENYPEYMKVSGFTLKKDGDPNALGGNQITMRFNTIFPKEKIAKKMFKDYDQLMEQKKAEQAKGAE